MEDASSASKSVVASALVPQEGDSGKRWARYEVANFFFFDSRAACVQENRHQALRQRLPVAPTFIIFLLCRGFFPLTPPTPHPPQNPFASSGPYARVLPATCAAQTQISSHLACLAAYRAAVRQRLPSPLLPRSMQARSTSSTLHTDRHNRQAPKK